MIKAFPQTTRRSSLSVELDRPPSFSQGCGVVSPKNDRPYFDAWLRRTGRQFAVSGRLSQTAMALAASEGGSTDEWRTRLRTLLEGHELPSLDLLTRIDALLAAPAKSPVAGNCQGMLF